MSRFRVVSASLALASVLALGVSGIWAGGPEAVADAQADQIMGGGCGFTIDVSMMLSCTAMSDLKGTTHENCPAEWFLTFKGAQCSGHVMTVTNVQCRTPCGIHCGGYKGSADQVCVGS